MPITVPTAVVAEWWRGQRGPNARLLDATDVEPLTEDLARMVGEALAVTRSRGGASVVDAAVMASAAQRGDLVLTGDVKDLAPFCTVFPGVRVLAV
jgi:predicted nucleic acid-binding protein